MAKIGIFGGTFDPIHNGHLSLALEAKEKFHLGKVIFVPTGQNPFKEENPLSDGKSRLKMVELALKPYEDFDVSDFEIDKGGICYTIDTVKYFDAVYPDDELYFIVGGDAFLSFGDWRNAEEILDYVTVIGGGRVGYPLTKTPFGDEHKERMVAFTADLPDISSSQLRRCASLGWDLRDFTSYAVAEYIEGNNLYEDTVPLPRLNVPPLSLNRQSHCCSVASFAYALAKRWGADSHKAYLAGLLHDRSRQIPGADYEKIMAKYGIPITEEAKAAPILLHGDVSALIAIADYNIRDKEIIRGILNHTIGCGEMTLFDKIIFLADKIEPLRSYDGVEKLRELAFVDLDEALRQSVQSTVEFNRQKNIEPHKKTIGFLNSLIK